MASWLDSLALRIGNYLFGLDLPDDKPTAPPTEDWQVGDLAQCILGGQWWLAVGNHQEPASGPVNGDVYRVCSVERPHRPMPWSLGLRFSAWPGYLFPANAFRKITPRADEATRAESEFIDLLKRAPADAGADA